MPSIGVRFIGRFGNQAFQYVYARAYAERNGLTLQTEHWIGQRVFALDEPLLNNPDEMLPTEYRQDQASIIYSRDDCRRWLTFQPHIVEILQGVPVPKIAAHLRIGDYPSCGYPVTDRFSVESACLIAGLPPGDVTYITEEEPFVPPYFAGDLSWVPDFYRLMSAPVLFRANSSFSYWAAVLSKGRVFAPVIDGHHCPMPYVEGNWPKLADLPCCTDLHLE